MSIFRIIIISILCLPCSGFGQAQDSVEEKGSFAIYPALGYQPETSLQLGAVAVWVLKSTDLSQNEYHRQSSVTPYFLYTLKKQVLTEIIADIYFSSGLNLNISPRFYNFPDVYYGIGNSNDPDEFENYTNRYVQLEGQLFKPLNPRTFIGIAFDLQNNKLKDLQPDGRLITEDVNGVEGGSIFSLGPSFKYDSRDNALYPSRGYLINTQIRPVIFGDYAYTNFMFDFRKYLAIKSEKNILAFHFNLNFSSGKSIPFYKLPRLGGGTRLRGISNASLYRDRQAVFTQLEYRRHLFWRFGMVAFAGIGDVANSFEDYRFSEFKYVGGIGLRFAAIKGQKLNFRLDIGFASGGQNAFYVDMREAF